MTQLQRIKKEIFGDEGAGIVWVPTVLLKKADVKRCQLKSFLEPLAQELEMDLLTLRDRIQSQFKDHDMFWGNYISEWYIDKDTLQPVWRNGCPTYRTSNVLSEVYKVIGNAREAVVKIDPTFKLPKKQPTRQVQDVAWRR